MLPIITDQHFKTKQGKECTYITAFDNGQIVHWYGDYTREDIKSKCEEYYLRHPAINHYTINQNVFNMDTIIPDYIERGLSDVD
jgi:hypothetical protein